MPEQQAFGDWLRLRRKALDLTRESLADRVGYSAATIRKIEAGERRPSAQVAELFAAVFNIPPSERPAFIRYARGDWRFALAGTIEEAPWRTLSVPFRSNLPVLLTSFVGREKEVEEVVRLLRDHRLVVLTGPGGMGKTRLAIESAGKAANTFKDGVAWVDLTALNDERFILSKVAGTLGIQEAGELSVIGTIISRLRPENALLVLDNCEHLIRACAQLATDLLTTCPGLKILATSRESLGVFGERIWRTPAMLLPDTRVPVPLDELRQFDGILLFLERAVATSPDFSLNQSNAPAIAAICSRLDGIPLAIEMAAARVASLPVQDLAARLDERFNLLTTGDRVALPRHQTLRAMIDGSYNLLSPAEQRLLCRLSVFAGGFTLEAAESVCAGEGGPGTRVVNLLSHLISKSLVTIEAQSGEPRFRMLETIRDYAQEKLERSGEADAFHRRHLDYFLALAEAAAPVLWGAVEQVWLKRLGAEQDNMRAALRYSLADGLAEQNLRLAVSLTLYWYVRSEAEEARQWLDQALASSTASSVSPSVRAYALKDNGIFALILGDFQQANALLEESRRLYEALQNQEQVGWTLHHLGLLSIFQGDYSLAAERSIQSLNIFEQMHARNGAGSLKVYIGLIAYYQGDFSRARALLEESLPILQEIGDAVAVARALHGLALVEQKQGNHDRAGALFKESLLTAQQKGDRLEMIKALEGLGSVACARGLTRQSAELLSAAEALRARIRYCMEPGLRSEIDRTLAALREQLDPQTFAKAWDEGSAMTLEQAIQYALEGMN
jgi:predicted ATPase/DNA-binding XRE family transcriptional regulator